MCLRAARGLTLLTWRAGREQAVAVQTADASREHCTQRCTVRREAPCAKAARKDGGAPPGLFPATPLLFSSLLYSPLHPPPSRQVWFLRLGFRRVLLGHQGFTLLEGVQVLGRAWGAEPGVDVLGRSRCEEPGVNALRREHGRRFQIRQGRNERLATFVVSTLSGPGERVPEHRTRTRELQAIDDWLSNSLFDVRMQICRFGQNVRRDQTYRG